MTSKPVPPNPQTPSPPGLRQLAFAFPFLRKAQGKARASVPFTDEHEIYRLLAEREPSGAYLVSRKGMWHGGIHITEAGAGQALDLDAGLRCIADGVLIAYRVNQDYPVSELAMEGRDATFQAPYSTGFALVRHEMDFPRGSKLRFYSLYMHLMSNSDYGSNFPQRQKPAYWSRQWKVTSHAQDRPSPRAGQTVDPSQVGLHVRERPDGAVLGILPQGVSVSIGRKEKVHGQEWGQVTALHGRPLYPPQAGGYVEPPRAIGGWLYLGNENGGPAVEEVIPDSMFDRVIVTTAQTCTKSDPQGDGGGIPVRAGELIGHLGRYDSLNQCTSGTRMAHIEVFCDDSIQSFLEQGRAWVNQHGPHREDWATLGLPSGPTILRIAPGTVLYQRTEDNRFVPGADPQSRKTDAVQVYSLAELARDPDRRIPEPHPHPDPGYPVNWWHVDGVNAIGQPIDGWVCDFNHAGGRVTREFAQKWIDFECIADAHDPAHTIFATTPEWVDYASGANVAGLASRSKLSPLMLKVYDALFTRGDGKQAADELCTLAQSERGGYPWLMQAASRLIVRHESEWANPSKWKQLIAALEKQTGPRPHHKEEQKRIERLAWWDEVAAGVSGFPGSEVYYINPIGLVGNFLQATCSCNKNITEEELDLLLPKDVKAKGLFYAAHDTSVHGFDKGKFLDLLNRYMRENDIMTCVRKVHFISQMLHECDELRTNEEYRNKDGSIPSGWNNYRGGSNFHGRGLIQLTHDANYSSYGKFVGDATIGADPNKISRSIDHTTHSACWYWRQGSHWGDINPKADRNDFYAITVAVNGGFNHVDERFVALNKLAKLLGAKRCTTNPGLVFNDYQMEKSSLYGTNFYKTHSKRIAEAVEAVDAKRSAI
ncbi:glycoside hydrolase family 19 protein [Paraburkholderia sp. MMS20-SJTN17]|uniref:Glycoside hydrolase family 19 protein n=1 Tax=Paraburkholderia translucens TaxID=2886945 RepID=A0ABS8KGK2_9BURK|nr:glycoside hydrolase family 19 protein [Paraburkholderia sp. MMS20-SJTN17]MCC8403891.1 glycoside hydrolase family 19 protein [Paraburkholderia sp. MMS20-SJTN17]